MLLTDLIGGKPETDLEKAVDRFFLGRTISNAVGSFFDPDERRKKLELKLMGRALTQDSTTDNISTGIKTASWLKGPAKSSLARVLSHM